MKGHYCTAICLFSIFYAIAYVKGQSVNTNGIDDGFGDIGTNSIHKQGSPMPPTTPAPADSSLLNTMGLSDPAIRNYMTMVYGSLIGRPECVKRSVCMAGNYLRGTPGSDFLFTMADSYVPDNVRLLYNIFKNSMQYGQDCSGFVCTTDTSTTPASGPPPQH